ncbi:MAG: hypothetical protein JW741_22185 [Sedimentisphaerales bacterium]|nr:hypothetical protein [Sedimentisphaerales bacterium]
MTRELICADCGRTAPRTGTVQKYCAACSEKRDLKRKKLWARNHPLSKEQVQRRIKVTRRRKELAKEAGALMSQSTASDITWFDSGEPNLLWNVRIAIPFSYAASKNHIYTMRATGHLALRRKARKMREAIIFALRGGLHGRHVVHNKVWLDILVQKPNHKGDAVNVVDLVCDSVKEAVGIDDRWFSIRRLDWQIVKKTPRLFIGVGQDSDMDCQVCSYCGLIKPLAEFNRCKHSPLGVGRECKDCRRQGRILAKRKHRHHPDPIRPEHAPAGI